VFGNRATGIRMPALPVLCFSIFVGVPVGMCQVAQPPEKVEPGQHGQHGKQEHHHLHMVLGEENATQSSRMKRDLTARVIGRNCATPGRCRLR